MKTFAALLCSAGIVSLASIVLLARLTFLGMTIGWRALRHPRRGAALWRALREAGARRAV